MKTKNPFFLLFLLLCNVSQAQESAILTTDNGKIHLQPVIHGSLAISYDNKTIYVDPYGGAKLWKGLKSPDIILLTDIHGDHLHLKTLDSIDTSKAIFIVPQAVVLKLPEKYHSNMIVLNNGRAVHHFDFFIKAIPMYNLPEDSTSRHVKGRGNGYLITVDKKLIYISGDTEDIKEMRALEGIDVAFISMNLPYTMDIHQAASAVLEFQPKIVYPYHYRGKNGLSDVAGFKNLVESKNKSIEVRLFNWYPQN